MLAISARTRRNYICHNSVVNRASELQTNSQRELGQYQIGKLRFWPRRVVPKLNDRDFHEVDFVSVTEAIDTSTPVFLMFIVKDGFREKLKDADDSLTAAEHLYDKQARKAQDSRVTKSRQFRFLTRW